jgi:aminoglycoside 6'-N-acetyltransferase I
MTRARFDAICFDWGGTLMSEEGPVDIPMALWPQVRVIPGAIDMLAELHKRYPLHIATNATVSRRPMIQRALERAGLRCYFGEIFCYTELGHRKNELAFWQIVSARLGVPLARIAMLGDTLEHDVFAPRSFGIYSVWFNEGGRQRAPDVAVPTIEHLSAFVGHVDNARQDRDT